MIPLILSILLSAYLGIAFSILKKFEVDLFQAIVFNYLACVITGCVFSGYSPVIAETVQYSWFGFAMLMGALFIAVFNLIAFSTVRVGVTVTQTANKLSFVLPVIFSVLAYNEKVTILKLTGILLALAAVILVTYKKNVEGKVVLPKWLLFVPIILFISSGIIDTLTKYVERNFIHDSEEIANAYLITGFGVAAFIGSGILTYMFIYRKKRFEWKNVIGGILVGIPNYFSIYYFVKALQQKQITSSAIIPINNIGVLVVASLFGILVLKEKLSKLNYVGLCLAILAILIIYFGDIV